MAKPVSVKSLLRDALTPDSGARPALTQVFDGRSHEVYARKYRRNWNRDRAALSA